MTDKIARTVGELIEFLSELDPDTVPISHEPPFTGVMVVPQIKGSVLLASLWGTEEGRKEREANKPRAA